MAKKQIILIVRFAEVIISWLGIIISLGIFEGKLRGNMLLYYTNQSNIICAVVFTALLIYTLKHYRQDNYQSSPSLTRITFLAAIWITVTMLVYWVMLVPYIAPNVAYNFLNIVVHAIVPILMIGEYLFFSLKGSVTKSDLLLSLSFPFIYLVFSFIVGFGNIFTYQYSGGETTRFPYFFMDYDKVGLWMIAYILALFAFFFGIAYLARIYNIKNKGIK
ncbi:MAG: Pr6Pr family membrane protein [Bacilli bacterium]|jgi:hypothetical protein|nr:Pr6Pr family membrane protein [Bacilli bacterium]MCH4235991.1 Pr6Pr family membrane protein [Bacilli bacterium]